MKGSNHDWRQYRVYEETSWSEMFWEIVPIAHEEGEV